MSFQKLLLDRFLALYGPPQTHNPALFHAEWKRKFDGMDAEILASAVSLVIDRQKFSTWPTIGEVNAVVEEVSEGILSLRRFNAAALPPPPERTPTAQERARAAELVAEFKRNVAAKALEALGPKGGATA